MDLKDACNRIKSATHDEWAAHNLLIVETWRYLTVCLHSISSGAPHNRPLSDVAVKDRTLQQSIRDISLDVQPRATSGLNKDDRTTTGSSSSSVIPVSTGNALSHWTLSDLRSSSVHPAAKNIPSKVKKPNSTVSRQKRALDNIRHNAQKRYQVLEGSDINAILSQRITEFPPARAGGDVARRKRHSLHRIAIILEGFLGAMYIAEKYRTFQQVELARRGRNPGNPKNVYGEFAHSLGITDSNVSPIIKLGESLLRVWSSGHYALLLLLDQLETLRRLSAADATGLGRLCCDEPHVRKIMEKLNAPVHQVYDGYRKVADGIWTVEKRAAIVHAITEIMDQLDIESSNIDENGGETNLHGSCGEMSTVRTISSCPTPNDGHECSTSDPAHSDYSSPSSRGSSTMPSRPGQDNSIGRQRAQNGASESHAYGGMNALLAAALDPQRSPEHEDDSSTTVVASHPPEIGTNSQGPCNSAADPAYPGEPDTLGESGEHPRKRRRLNDGVGAGPRSPGNFGTTGRFMANSSSTFRESDVAHHVDDHTQLLEFSRDAADRLYADPVSLPSMEPQTAGPLHEDYPPIPPLNPEGWREASASHRLLVTVDEWYNLQQYPQQSLSVPSDGLVGDVSAVSANTVPPLTQSNEIQKPPATARGARTALDFNVQGSPLCADPIEEELDLTIRSDPQGMSFMNFWPFDHMKFADEEEDTAGMSFMNEFAPDHLFTHDPFGIFRQE